MRVLFLAIGIVGLALSCAGPGAESCGNFICQGELICCEKCGVCVEDDDACESLVCQPGPMTP